MKIRNNPGQNILLTISLGLVLSIMTGAGQAAVVPGNLYSNNTTGTALNLDGYFTTEYMFRIEAGDGINLSTNR